MLEILGREVKLAYGFVRRDCGTGLLPVPLFTLASLLYRQAPTDESIRILGKAFVYGFLYLYSFVVANQINGIEEDKINKPDRPLASGLESLSAAKIRLAVLNILYFTIGYVLGVPQWTLLWMFTTTLYNFMGFSDFGPTKDLCMGSGCIAQLMAAWKIGGSPYNMGWYWVRVITLYMTWPIPLQDLRDIPGDKAIGRRTTPILLGDMPARIYIGLGIVVSQSLLIKYCILNYQINNTTVALSAVLGIMTIFLVARLFMYRSITNDRFSYWYYTIIYVLQPVSAALTIWSKQS